MEKKRYKGNEECICEGELESKERVRKDHSHTEYLTGAVILTNSRRRVILPEEPSQTCTSVFMVALTFKTIHVAKYFYRYLQSVGSK